MNRNSYKKRQNLEAYKGSHTERPLYKKPKSMQYQVKNTHQQEPNHKFMNAYPLNNKHRQRIYGRERSPVQPEIQIKAYPSTTSNNFIDEDTPSRVSRFLNKSIEKSGHYPLSVVTRNYLNGSQIGTSKNLMGRNLERGPDRLGMRSCSRERRDKENFLASKSFQGALPVMGKT